MSLRDRLWTLWNSTLMCCLRLHKTCPATFTGCACDCHFTF